MIACWAVYIGRYGVAPLHQQFEAIQPGLLNMLISGIWCDSMGAIPGATPRKLTAIASARLLAECPSLHTDAATFGKLLQSTMLMLLQDQSGGGGGAVGAPAASAAAEELADSAEIENAGGGAAGGGYAAAYAQLSFASAQEEPDLYPGEQTAAYVVKALQGLHSRSAALLPAVVPPMIAALPQEKQQGVQALLQGVC